MIFKGKISHQILGTGQLKGAVMEAKPLLSKLLTQFPFTY